MNVQIVAQHNGQSKRSKGVCCEHLSRVPFLYLFTLAFSLRRHDRIASSQPNHHHIGLGLSLYLDQGN